MKKIFFAISVLAVAFGFTACSNEDEVIENENCGKLIVTAFTEQGATRTALDGNDTKNYDVVWDVGDKFYAYKKVPVGTFPNFTLMFQRVDGAFNLISEAGKTNGTFKKDGDALPTSSYYAFYGDFPDAFSFDNLDGYYPTVQTYTEGNIKGFPMMATFDVNNGEITGPISFKNMNGILRLTVKGAATVKSIKVSAKGLDPITLNCGDEIALTPEGKLFHIAMPTGTFTGVEIALTDTKGKKCVKSFKGTKGLVIERSKITKASFTASDFKSYNVGSKVTIGGHEGIVVDLRGTLGKVIVATMNVGAESVNGSDDSDCFGTKMTYDKACEAWSGWRLPTVEELTAFCDPGYPGVCGHFYEDGTGAVMWNIDGVNGIDLYLPLNDYDEDGNPSDKYWTQTPGKGGKYYYFAPAIEFDGDYPPLEPKYIRKEEAAIDSEDSKFLVRLFHDLP